jgi:hypothetical protein
MATYERRERTVRRVDWCVPAGPLGACWAEVWKAVRAAHEELWELELVPMGRDAADDQIRIHGDDEAVIVTIETPREDYTP